MEKTKNLLRIRVSAMVNGSRHVTQFWLKALITCALRFRVFTATSEEGQKACVKQLRAVARELGVDQIRDGCGRSEILEWFQ